MDKKQHFDSFDALRFLSFLIVFFSHLPYSLFRGWNFLNLNGTIGVNFFFILSGFLITYILLFEKKSQGSIHLKNFFIRRILRIWPLYYLAIFFAFSTPYVLQLLGLSSSDVGYSPNWLFSCLFLENYISIYHNSLPNVSPLPVIWSLCVEEHFYIIWGFLLYFTRTKRVLPLIGVFIIIGYISRYIFFLNDWQFKDIFTNIDYFMYGAIPAYFYVNNKEQFCSIINKISNPIRVLIVVSSVLLIYFTSHNTFENSKFIEPLVFGILFTSVVTLFITDSKNFKISSSMILSKLGKFTYSLYLLHTIIINFLIQLFFKMDLIIENNTILFIVIALLLTISASYLSYRIIEKPFLRLKRYFL